MRLKDLGPRICILGPSNSGKSTLARAIGRALDAEVVHLDLFFHHPGTDWVARPEAEFLALHDEAVAHDRWVMDGNYSKCMSQRFLRATGLILLDVSTGTSLLRYVRRTLFEGGRRAGALPGGRDSLKWNMIRLIAVTQRRSRLGYANRFQSFASPKIALRSRRAIETFYENETLDRRAAGPR